MRILVSACLLGRKCRYDGSGEAREEVMALGKRHELIPFCPEVSGGLSTPRCPAERLGERIVTQEGVDVTKEYARGAENALSTIRSMDCSCAILKQRSPSCGVGTIYDGTFTKALIKGDGMTTEVLKRAGIAVYGDGEISCMPVQKDD